MLNWLIIYGGALFFVFLGLYVLITDKKIKHSH